MAELNIRPIDGELYRALKVSAAKHGKTLREHVIAVLEESEENPGLKTREAVTGVVDRKSEPGTQGPKQGGKREREAGRELTYEMEAPE